MNEKDESGPVYHVSRREFLLAAAGVPRPAGLLGQL
jgi:hypothetical protein